MEREKMMLLFLGSGIFNYSPLSTKLKSAGSKSKSTTKAINKANAVTIPKF